MSGKRALFFAEAVTLAHVVRSYQLARSLLGEGYEVHFAVAPRFRFVYDEPEIRMHWISSKSGETFLDNVETGRRLYRAHELIGYAREELEVIEAVQPDWVLGDFRHSLSISAKLAGVPYLNLINTYWSPRYAGKRLPVPELRQFPLSRFAMSEILMPVLTPIIFKAQGQPLNEARRHFNLEPFDHCLHGWAGGDQTIFCDVPECFDGYEPAANEHFIGHVTWEPSLGADQTERWLEAMTREPHIYVALGSSGGRGLRDRVVERVLGAGYPVCVSGVPDRERPSHWPDRVLSAEFVSGSAVAAAAGLVITNGGSPTTYQALDTGTPVIGIPANMDQVLCIHHVDKLNAGRVIRPWEVQKPRFLRTVEEVMEGACRAQAQRWAAWSKGMSYRSRFLEVLDKTVR